MKKFLLGLVLLLSTACPLFGQATTGFHRTAVALARAFQGVTAQVVPNAKVTVTATATGLAATIYSDPALGSQITPAVVTADNSGNYGYYIALNYCVTETITSPGQGTQVIPNICNNAVGGGGGTVSDGAGTTTAGLQAQSTGVAHQIAYVPPYSVNLCAAPSTATCDGTTDDHVAVQTILDAGYPSVFIPWSLSGTVINTGTVGITINNPGMTFYGNGQTLKYSGSGSAVAFSTGQVVFSNTNQVRDVHIDTSAATGSFKVWDLGSASTNQVELINDGDYGSASGGCTSVFMVDGAYLNVVNYLGSDAATGCKLDVSTSNISASVNITTSIFGGTSLIDTLDGTFADDGFYAVTVGSRSNTSITLATATLITGQTLTFGGFANSVSGTVKTNVTPVGAPANGVIAYPDLATNKVVAYAHEIDLLSNTAADLKGNGSEICTFATGCGGGLPSNAFGNLLNNGSGTLSWRAPYCVRVDQPPYNAACDNATDDYTAINDALQAGYPCIALPPTVQGNTIACKVGTGLVDNGGTIIEGSNSLLVYTGTSGVAVTCASFAPCEFDDLGVSLTATSGTIGGILLQQGSFATLKNTEATVQGSPFAGFTPLEIDGAWADIDLGIFGGRVAINTTSAGLNSGVSIRNSFIGPAAGVFSHLVDVTQQNSPISIANTVLNMQSSTGGSDCVICINNTGATLGGSAPLKLDNVALYTTNTFTGNVINGASSGGGKAPVIVGTINSYLPPASFTGNFTTGTWSGPVTFNGTTYKSSAALVTYRCLTSGSLPAGSITTVAAACGTSTPTGDSSQ